MNRVINPYNFVPFYGESFDVAPDRKSLEEIYGEPSQLLSGWIDVKVTTKTPLIIPEGNPYDSKIIKKSKDKNGKDQVHNSYHFFRLPGNNNNADGPYAIPGSELRGMIRSMYEAASNSCFPFYKKAPKDPISQRTPIYAAFRRRGLLEYDLENDKWTLYRAKAHVIKVKTSGISSGKYEGYKTGEKVNFSLDGETIKLEKEKGDLKGYLQFNLPVDRAKDYHVAVLEKKEAEYEWNIEEQGESAYDCLMGSLFDSAKNSFRRNRNVNMRVSTMNDLKEALERVKNNGGCVPVYFFCVNRSGRILYYLSGAAIGRVHQRRSWEEIMGEHRSCHSLKQLCPACALFGTAKDGASAGRVRFTDAIIDVECKPEVFPVTLPILGEPRSSSFEFYLRKPFSDATYWNYDYYGIKGTVGDKDVTDYKDLSAATPRGRKLYWHSDPEKGDHKASHMNSTMDAIENASFRFRIYYDRITEDQRKELIWVITLGENNDNSNYRHKLGHAKPVGYGSVKLTITGGMDRKVAYDSIQSKLSVEMKPVVVPEKPDCCFQENDKTIESIKRMTDWTVPKGKTIAYPTGSDNKIFSWFQANRTNPKSLLTLPEPWDADLTLPTKRPKGSTDDSKRGNPGKKRKPFAEEKDQYPPETILKGTLKFPKGKTEYAFVNLDGPENDGFLYLGNAHLYRNGDHVWVKITEHSIEKGRYKVKIVDNH